MGDSPMNGSLALQHRLESFTLLQYYDIKTLARKIMTATDITGIVLSGGRGSRMGGADKGLVKVNDRWLIEHVIERLSGQVGQVLINANRSVDEYSLLGIEIVQDADLSFNGPLAGVLAGMNSAQTEWLVTVPCDAPEIPLDLVSRLYARALADDLEICCAFAGDRLQPVFALYKVDVKPALNTYLDSGDRKIDRFFKKRRFGFVSFENEAGFANLNSLEEVEGYEKSILSGR